MIIDEWDAICREFDNMPEVVNKYVNLLRRLFKADDTNKVFMGVYMTGILPIKRYNTQSALNNFREYTDNLLLVGISYDLDEKVHVCRIEKL